MDDNVKLKQLLIDNGFFEQEELETLISSQSDVIEDQSQVLYRAIESKDRAVIQQIHDVISQSGLVTTDESDNTDSGHQCIPYIKNDVNDLFYQLEDLMVSVENIKVKTATEVRGPPECYRMSRKRRGYCVIINNKKFYKHSYRRGSAADEQRLKQVFEQLGFELKTYHNLSANGITEKLKKLSKDQRLSKDEALIVIILSHGTVDDVVVGSDDEKVTVQSLLEFFNVKNCLQLMDKPKIFFINACRGEKKDHGIDLRFRECRSLSGDGPVTYSLTHRSTWSDFVVVYSTSKDYVSLRSPKNGSMFGCELASGLAEWAHNTEFVKLMTQKVADSVECRESQLKEDSGVTPVKQAIETRILGRVKDLYFNPGYYEKY